MSKPKAPPLSPGTKPRRPRIKRREDFFAPDPDEVRELASMMSEANGLHPDQNRGGLRGWQHYEERAKCAIAARHFFSENEVESDDD